MKSLPRRFLLVIAGAAALAFGVAGAGAAPADYAVDPVHSSVIFRVKHAGVAYVYGRFNTFSGTFRIDDENPANANVSMTVDVASVDTGNEKRDQHLKSPDFFNVAQFPRMTFESTSVTKKADDRYAVKGDLTLHGKTNPVEIEMAKTGEGTWRGARIVGFEGTTTLKRSDYGMTNMLDAVGDEIRFTIAVEARRQ